MRSAIYQSTKEFPYIVILRHWDSILAHFLSRFHPRQITSHCKPQLSLKLKAGWCNALSVLTWNMVCVLFKSDPEAWNRNRPHLEVREFLLFLGAIFHPVFLWWCLRKFRLTVGSFLCIYCLQGSRLRVHFRVFLNYHTSFSIKWPFQSLPDLKRIVIHINSACIWNQVGYRKTYWSKY